MEDESLTKQSHIIELIIQSKS